MRQSLNAIPLLLLVCLPVVADSIDEAEAKRRGVPVQQVQLENAQRQIQQLQSQLADANKKLKDLSVATQVAAPATQQSKSSPSQTTTTPKSYLASIEIGMSQDDAEKNLLKDGLGLSEIKTVAKCTYIDTTHMKYSVTDNTADVYAGTTIWFRIAVQDEKVLGVTLFVGDAKDPKSKFTEMGTLLYAKYGEPIEGGKLDGGQTMIMWQMANKNFVALELENGLISVTTGPSQLPKH